MILIIVLSIVGVLLLAGLFVLLYIFVISRNGYKRQIKDLERKYSYLDALLLGQDSQYIHRLEIVSRTNLLYVDIYNDFSRRFKEIYEIDDKFASTKINQAKTMILNKQYKNIKNVINDVKNAVSILENRVNSLDNDLYEVIKPEEESRQTILKLKESYRAVKQTFYASSNDVELVISSFNKAFEKLDDTFTQFENHIDSAEYDEANALIPMISQVVNALKNALEQMPNLCIIVTKLIPERIDALTGKYQKLEAQSYPLFHLAFHTHVDDWNYQLSLLKKKLITLNVAGVRQKCDEITDAIVKMDADLEQEVVDKNYFLSTNQSVYHDVLVIEKTFLKICSILPEVEQIYKVEDEQHQQLDILKENINKLGISKRSLDAFVHSSTPQPYSVLRARLEVLIEDYNSVNDGIIAFKGYLDSLRTSSEEAYAMIFVYYYRLREAENLLHSIYIPEFAERYTEDINSCYDLLNEIDQHIKEKPIDVTTVNEKVDQLKKIANNLFDEIDNKVRESQLAESAIVYANRDRAHQSDVHSRLIAMEKRFFDGEFESVYHDATNLFRNSHVD